jgi:glutamate dehydrogenase
LDFYKASFDDLRENVLDYLEESERTVIQGQIDRLQAQGVPAELAKQVGILSTLFSALDIADIVHETKRKVSAVAPAYFNLGARMSLHWFLEQINGQPVDNHWQALARAAFREELDWQQRSLTMSMLKTEDANQEGLEILEAWLAANRVYVDRWLMMLSDFRTTKTHEFAKFSVALRELMLLNHNCTSV